MGSIIKLTLFGRRELEIDSLRAGKADALHIVQHKVDVLDPESYKHLTYNHTVAICTLGVGQPSKISKDEFIRIDKTAVLEFATACKSAGVQHFQLLGSLGASSQSRSFYLRVKGELQDDLRALNFERLSLFQPSMILTPTNRYGLSQAITLFVWPLLAPLLIGPLRKMRGISVDQLGCAIANNICTGTIDSPDVLQWDAFVILCKK